MVKWAHAAGPELADKPRVARAAARGEATEEVGRAYSYRNAPTGLARETRSASMKTVPSAMTTTPATAKRTVGMMARRDVASACNCVKVRDA